MIKEGWLVITYSLLILGSRVVQSPNCYGFPFDDMSSTSTCMTEENGYNVQNYTITLCPNGPFPS